MKLTVKLGSKTLGQRPQGTFKPIKQQPVGGTAHGTPSWLTTDPRKQKEMADEQRNRQNRSFIPEMWLKPDEDKMVRFRHPGCLATLLMYRFKTKSGQFEKITAPDVDHGAVDLFADSGMRASFVAVYEVIDINGYVDNKGKRHKNVPRFYLASQKVFEQLEKIRLKRQGLDKQDIEISRVGEGNQTAYTFMPEDPTPMTAEMRKAESLKAKMIDLFSPPNEQEQQRLISMAVPSNFA